MTYNKYEDGVITIQFPTPVKMYHIYYFIGIYHAGNYAATGYDIYGIDDDWWKLKFALEI